MSKKRPLTRSELDLWRRFTADVRPLAEMPDENVAEPARPPTERRGGESAVGRTAAKGARTPGSRPLASSSPRMLDPTRPIDIDRRNWERLKRGKVDIERKLDLHGRTQIEAHEALNRFLSMASATGLRCILVVTGKGGIEGRGVLRQMVPRWLAEANNRDKVLTFCAAQPRHGGDGALYVLLKRRRERGRM